MVSTYCVQAHTRSGDIIVSKRSLVFALMTIRIREADRNSMTFIGREAHHVWIG